MTEAESWKTRVLAEKAALDENIDKLDAALAKPINHERMAGIKLLIRQLAAMREYSAILAARIELWS